MKEIFLGDKCRGCINEHYGLSLNRKDCFYHYYKDTCVLCGQMKPVVTGVRFYKRWKLLFKKRIK